MTRVVSLKAWRARRAILVYYLGFPPNPGSSFNTYLCQYWFQLFLSQCVVTYIKYKGYDLSTDFKDVVFFPVTRSFHPVKPGMDNKYYHSPFR